MKTKRLPNVMFIKVFSFVLLVSTFGVTSVYAQMVKVPLEELSRKSHTILRGTVSEKWSEYEEDGKNIITFIKIDASRSIKGKSIESDTVAIPGGIVGDVGMGVSHTPQFTIGEEVVIFISDDYKGRTTVTGWRQGKFPVIRDRVFYEDKEIQAADFVRELEKFVQQGEQGNIEMDIPDEPKEKQQQPDGSSMNMLLSGPSISSISPNSGPALRPYAIDPNDPFDSGERGFVIDIYGSGFGSSQSSSVVRFYESAGMEVDAADYLSWSNTHIQCVVPGRQWDGSDFLHASSGVVYVVTSGGESNGKQFDVTFGAPNKRFSNSSISFNVNQNGTPDASGEFTSIQNALQTWSNVSNSTLSFQYGGTTSRMPTSVDNFNDIGWIESNWPYDPSNIAVNTYRASSSVNSNVIYESDIRLNGVNFTWSTSGESGKRDVQNIVTHELGHALNLQDLYGGEDEEKTMYWGSSTGDTKRRTLEQEDKEGAVYLYPQSYSLTLDNEFEFSVGTDLEVDVKNVRQGTNTISYDFPLSETVDYGTEFELSPTHHETINNDDYYFSFWSDGSTDNPRSLTISSNNSIDAIYKGIQLSNNTDAFTDNSQRRLIQTEVDGDTWLHQVYTSMGHVWLEHSDDGGATWTLGNDGKPLDGNSSGAKNPSIAYTYQDFGFGDENNYIGIVWQEKNGSNYRIKAKMCTQMSGTSGIPGFFTSNEILYTEGSETYSGVDAHPNLVLGGGWAGPYLVTIEKKTTTGSYPAGINWLAGNVQGGGGQYNDYFNAPTDHGLIPDTDGNTTNTQASLVVGSSSSIEINFIRQQGTGSSGKIYSQYLTFDDQGGYWNFNEQVDDGLVSYSGWSWSPSLVSHDGDYSACWQELYDMVYFNIDNPSTLHYFGNTVKSCSIARGGSGSTDDGFAVWSQNPSSNWANKSVRFENGAPVTSSVSTLSTDGEFVQAGSSAGSGLSNMYVSSFYPQSSPYHFETSGALGPTSKRQQEQVVEGRGFIVRTGATAFRYNVGHLMVDGQPIRFVDAPAAADYANIERLNQALLTEPFTVPENAEIILSEHSGFADSAGAALEKGQYIRYRVELVDEATGQPAGTLKNEEVTTASASGMKSPSYRLNATSLAGKTLRARIHVETNLPARRAAPEVSADLPEAIQKRAAAPRPNLVLTKHVSTTAEAVEKSALQNLELTPPETPAEYALAQNYPNPFNPSTVISYQLPENSMVRLEVFDLLGRKVQTLVGERQPAGHYSVSFDASRLASGMYLYRLQAGAFTASKKLFLIK